MAAVLISSAPGPALLAAIISLIAAQQLAAHYIWSQSLYAEKIHHIFVINIIA